jgi:hypothetical protein
MAEGSDELERLSREQLILKARVLGVERAELMTRVELRDEIVRRSVPDPAQQKRARGFLGVARDLVASVVEAGLNLPDAAALIRGESSREGDWKGPPPVATVTLAEIYAAQGHLERALRMLDEVLAKEPDHDPARALRDRLAAGDAPSTSPNASPRKRSKIAFVEPPPESTEPDPDTDLDAAPPEISVSQPVLVPEPVVPEPVVPEPVVPEPVVPEPVVPEPVVPEPVVPEPVVPEPAPPRVVPPPAPSAPVLLTLSLSGRRQIYWEIPDQTLAPLRAHTPQGRPILRIIAFRPNQAGKIEHHSLDLSPHADIGSSELPGLSSSSIVRAALGWEADGKFHPFLLAADLAIDPPSSTGGNRYLPHPLVGGVAPDAERRALAHFTRRA